MQSLFEGPDSLREPSERLAFWLTAFFALPAALAIGYLLHESIGASQVALFIVLAMVYVTLARGRLLGSSVRVHERQYPRLFTIVREACAALDIAMPLIFVREDNYVPVVALGFGEPYAIVLSTHWIEIFRDDEVAFMVGRELGHIAAGHTRFHSLLSVNGNENFVVSLIFGAWLRRCALTCDKVGLLCCGTLEAAIRAMGIAAFHEFGRQVDYDAFAEQHAEIEHDSVLRWGEYLSGEPYATRRIASLRQFMTTPAYVSASHWFARERTEQPPVLSIPAGLHVERRDCAGWWRRFAAWGIDAIVVAAILTSFGGSVAPVRATPGGTTTTTKDASGRVHHVWTSDEMRLGPFAYSESGLTVRIGGEDLPVSPNVIARAISHSFGFWFPVYLAVLVIVVGQTFGMMIIGLRVVTTEFGRPSIARIIARYAIVFVLWWLILPLSLVWRRILLHDRWTRTRLVKVERIVARIVGTT